MNSSTKLIAITGANRGIGKVLVKRLIEHPDQPRILFTSRNLNLGKETCDELFKNYKITSDRLIYHQLDINSKQSVETFVDYLKKQQAKIDILVNNAGTTDRRDWEMDWVMPPETVTDILNTNFFSTVSLTEALLEHLTEEARIIMITSNLAQLNWQPKKVQDFLSTKMTRDQLMEEAEKYMKLAIENKHQENGYCKYVYHTSKALLNAYTRWVLVDKIGKSQTCFNVHPGWLKTRLGGNEAPKEEEEGVICTMKLIEASLEECKKYNGDFLNEDGTPLEY